MVTNETQEQLEARGWDFTEEFIPDEGVMEYRDVSSLSSVRKLNMLENIAFMAKANVPNALVIIMPAFQLRTYTDAGVIRSDDIVAVSTNLNTLQGANYGGEVNTLTLEDLLREHDWLDSWNSCPILTKEQFYDLNM